MLIGIDFDNTIALYHDAAFKTARDLGYISLDTPRDKTVIRNILRRLDEGDIAWQKVQAHIYGPAMQEAVLAPGFKEAITSLRSLGASFVIISHKTEFSPIASSPVNLREAALKWMKDQGLFSALGFKSSEVHFHQTREEKLDQIRALRCDWFIDDLPEIFLESRFPKMVQKILFGKDSAPDWIAAGSWGEIQMILSLAIKASGLLSVRALGDYLVKKIPSGGNNQVLKLEPVDVHRSAIVLKHYLISAGDTRDRLATEFTAHKFLWDEGVRCIAQPIEAKAEIACAVYEFLKGAPFHPSKISEEDLSKVIAFIKILNEVSRLPHALSITDASEASFSMDALIVSIQKRINTLKSVTESLDQELHGRFVDFLNEKLCPTFAEEIKGSKEQIQHVDTGGFETGLPKEGQLLSPSDFGFHNALKNSEGAIFFHDFEYFGWDDPAKLICDFMLHPAMNLSEAHQKYFLTSALKIWNCSSLAHRIQAVYPLYAIKWCCIVLNQFVPEYRARKLFAKPQTIGELLQSMSNQLNKSMTLLDRRHEINTLIDGV